MYVSFTEKYRDMITRQEDISCTCPIPCNNVIYQTSISYSTTSNLNTDGVLRDRRLVGLSKLLRTVTNKHLCTPLVKCVIN